MTDEARELLHKALELPTDARVVLATELVASLEKDSPVDDLETIEREWAEEIKRRLQDVLSGRVQTVPFDEAIAKARQVVAEVRRQS